jgi:hypothetical protein
MRDLEHLLLGAFARLPSCWTRQAAHAPRAHHQKVPFDPERGLAPSCELTKAAGAVAALPTAKNQLQQLHGPVISAAAAEPKRINMGREGPQKSTPYPGFKLEFKKTHLKSKNAT